MNALIKIVVILMLPWQAVGQKRVALEPATINFVIKNAGLSVDGSIGGLEGFVTMDLENSVPVKIEGTIDPNTIATGIALRDKHLKKSDYFNVKEYPKISMASTEIKRKSKGKYVGNFDLTIKGIKKTVMIPFNFSTKGNTYVLKGEFSINRLDFHLGENSVILSDNVKIKIELKAG
jgi:polyisoprenoid-binding protein YceI